MHEEYKIRVEKVGIRNVEFGPLILEWQIFSFMLGTKMHIPTLPWFKLWSTFVIKCCRKSAFENDRIIISYLIESCSLVYLGLSPRIYLLTSILLLSCYNVDFALMERTIVVCPVTVQISVYSRRFKISVRSLTRLMSHECKLLLLSLLCLRRNVTEARWNLLLAIEIYS